MADVNSHVKTVIEVLHDGHEGFTSLGEHVKDPTVKQYFESEAVTRHKFEQELRQAVGISKDIGGTASGAMHRTWGDIKAHMGGGDHTLLETAEQGEDAAKKAYHEALEDAEVNGILRDLLVRQHTHILASHDKVKAFRDNKN